jgi:hypothetical protein
MGSVAMTHRSRSPAPAGEKKGDKGAVVTIQKVAILPTKNFTVFKTSAMTCVSIIITTVQGPTSA